MQLRYTAAAREDLDRLPTIIADRILDKMDWFALQDDPLHFAKPLQGTAGRYRFRIGDYRVIFTMHQNEVIILVVLAVKHRGNAYK